MAKMRNSGLGIVIALAILGYKVYTHYMDSRAAGEQPVPAVELAAAIGAPGLPMMGGSDEIIAHMAYTLSYNEAHEQANWVAYWLTAADLAPSDVRRRDNFRPDPEVDEGSATLDDYRRSGYDRGHLAPAADMKRSEEVMSESFYMSNMSPQTPGLNRGIWKDLEELVRQYALGCDSLQVVTGPVLAQGLEQIGANGVSVPRYYYKVLLDIKKPGIKAIGFVMSNTRLEGRPEDYAVTVDSVEKLTGIDFFAGLEDSLEARLESAFDLNQWR